MADQNLESAPELSRVPAQADSVLSGARDPLERLAAGEVLPVDERQLRDRRLIGADLAGLDLGGWDLSGADLSRAKLAGACLAGAKLRGAILFEADLTEAELLGADLSEVNAREACLARAGLGQATLSGAEFALANLEGASLIGAVADSAHFGGACLVGARLTQGQFHAADFDRADLTRADLSGADVDEARFDDAILREANLRQLTGYPDASWLRIDLTGIDFNGAYILRSVIMDQNFLEEFRRQSRYHQVMHWIWSVSSDCGRSPVRWGLWACFVMALFAVGYTWVDVDLGSNPTPLSELYFSIVTFTTLGYGDILPVSAAAQVLVMFEVLIGYVMLGGLLSIFSNQMARRAS